MSFLAKQCVATTQVCIISTYISFGVKVCQRKDLMFWVTVSNKCCSNIRPFVNRYIVTFVSMHARGYYRTLCSTCCTDRQQLSLALLYVQHCVSDNTATERRQSVTTWNKPISPIRTSDLSYCSQRSPPFHMHNSALVAFLTTPSYPLTPSAHSITRCSSFAYGPCPLRAPRQVAKGREIW